MSHDVAIVGAGLAGLVCAKELTRSGRDVVLLESGDAPGGRVRTDVVDGFVLDRGFQVLLTGYPELRRHLDLDALDLRPFAPGVAVRFDDRFHTLADPLQDPVGGVTAVTAPVGTLADKLRFLKLRWRVTSTAGQRLAHQEQSRAREALRAEGFSDVMIERFFRPFLAGIFFDPDLTTSNRMVDLVFRSFFRGDVAVPATGMQRIPEQLAAALPDGVLRLNTAVETVARGVVRTAEGGVEADTVVVAVDGPAATAMLGQERVPPVVGRGAMAVHLRAPRAPIAGPKLVLDADGDGPIATLAVMTEVSERYGPPGESLITVSLVGDTLATDGAVAQTVLSQAGRWFGDEVDEWTPLRVDRIPFAQPRQDPEDLPSLRRPVRLDDDLYVCGDHRDTASIQGAMVSGRRTAEAILAGA